MPYNTRRKSLSLPSLGIQLPQSSRSHQTPPSSVKGEQPPHKRVKRDHSPIPKTDRYDPTPPPSPQPDSNINYAEINDEIVSGVVGILERTGNRPHTVKELAVSLAPIVNLVENSANPHAIISSRLNAYLKRGSTSTPCLLKKELITTHPRRIYFYLTTCPSQPIPQHENDMSAGRRSVVSPAISDEEEGEMQRRLEMSPSPEVDLSSHELDDGDSTDTGSLVSTTTASMIARQGTRSPSSLDQKNVLASPPLEGDEREFSQSAIYIERRRRSASREKEKKQDDSNSKQVKDEYESESVSNDERTYEEAATLLGYPTVSGVGAFSSPTLAATTLDRDAKREDVEKIPEKMHHSSRFAEKADLYSWGGEFERHLGSPESVELDELDNLLDF